MCTELPQVLVLTSVLSLIAASGLLLAIAVRIPPYAIGRGGVHGQSSS